MENNQLSLVESFQQFFSVELAETEEQKDGVFRIRYRVYCDEFKYEPASRFPGGREFDGFDEYALHGLITHRSSGMPAGCVRLIPGTVSGIERELPFERACGNALDRALIESLDIDRSKVCEISRLAVDGAFRRRSGEAATRFGEVEAMDCTLRERRTFSLIAVAGFLAATALTELSGRTHVFAMMEPFLPRMLERSGIIFRQVGSEIDYHGVRAPYFIRTRSALDNMRVELKELYETIHKQMAQSFTTRDSGKSKMQRTA